MLKLFRRNKADIDSLSVPNFGWELIKESDSIRQWINPEKTTAISVNFFDAEPDIPSPKNLDQLRKFYRDQIIQQNGGLIEVSVSEIKGFESVKTIFKIPQEPKGTMYLASLVFPFRKFSFVVKIQVPEMGITGIRELAISERLLSQNEISKGEYGFIGWSRDPYDASVRGGEQMNKSEEEIYDAEFPDHPLSIIRKILESIETQVEFGTKLERAKKLID
jgi:hypothetical protein